jgi:copper oxidase (laccase) domain-containing protein
MQKMIIAEEGIIRNQLIAFGVKNENIEDNKECTMENPEKYFSFRRDKSEKVEAMVTIIGIRK